MDDGQRPGDAQVVVHGRAEVRRDAHGVEARKRLLRSRPEGPSEEALDAVHRGRSLREGALVVLDHRAVVGGGEVVAHSERPGHREDPVHLEGVAEGLAHLLAAHGHPGVVEPVVGEPESGRAGLGLFVLVVREAQVDAAAVDVEGVAEVLARHRRALEVPAGAPSAIRGRPGGGRRLTRLASLPQGEVARVALPARVGVLCRGHVIERLPGELAVCRPGLDVEVDVARAVCGGIRVALVDQGVHELDHLGDVTGGAGLIGGREDAERIEGRGGRALVGVGDDVPGGARRRRLDEDLVVDIGDIADQGDVVPVTALKPPA